MEKDKEYYNEIFKTAPQYSLSVDSEHSWHADLYDYVISLFNKDDLIIELGSGTGQFAKYIIDNGFNYVLGIDFSETGIELCQKRCPNVKFICEDLYNVNLLAFDYNTILSLETMEHINGDLEVISKIKRGSKVIISVPSFDGDSHVRFFNNRDEVLDRYYHLFSEIDVIQVNRYFVIVAKK